jgi:hypothetical protein
MYGAFPVKRLFWFIAGSLFGAGKPFFIDLQKAHLISTRSRSRRDTEMPAARASFSMVPSRAFANPRPRTAFVDISIGEKLGLLSP